jgi:hypothetical protein
MERRRIVTDLSYLRAQAASGGTAATPSAIVCLIHCPSAPVEFCHVSIRGRKPRHIELSHRLWSRTE